MADGNIIVARFHGKTKATALGLWQWDYGQILQIVGLDLPNVTEVHFAQNGLAMTKLGTTEEEVCSVPVPNSMLQHASSITAYIYLHTGEDDGETEYEIRIPVRARARPESYDEDDPEIQREYTALVEATELLNQTTEKVVDDARAAAEAVVAEFRNSPLYPSDGIPPNGEEENE